LRGRLVVEHGRSAVVEERGAVIQHGGTVVVEHGRPVVKHGRAFILDRVDLEDGNEDLDPAFRTDRSLSGHGILGLDSGSAVTME
jgi:hypothetical protein